MLGKLRGFPGGRRRRADERRGRPTLRAAGGRQHPQGFGKPRQGGSQPGPQRPPELASSGAPGQGVGRAQRPRQQGDARQTPEPTQGPRQARWVQDRVGEDGGPTSHLELPAGQHRLPIRHEGRRVGEVQPLGNPEERRHPVAVGDEGVALGAGELADEGLVGEQGRVRQGAVDPARQLRVPGSVGGAAGKGGGLLPQSSPHPGVDGVHPPRRGQRLLPLCVDDGEHRLQGAAQPPQGPVGEFAVVGDPRGHQRVGELHEERAGAGDEQNRFPVHRPEDAVGFEQMGHRPPRMPRV